MTPDVVVIGAGPAGCAAAIRLAQIGIHVKVYEKSHFPRRKLCGGFLSPESLIDLEQLGVLSELLQQGAHPIRRTLVSSPRGRTVEAPLPSPGLSISREVLDALLCKRAQALGVLVHEGQAAPPSIPATAWTVRASGRSIETAGTALYYGLQATFENVPGLTDQVELHLVHSGYVGLVYQGKGANVCALMPRSSFWSKNLPPDQVLKLWMRQNPLLRERLQEAQRTTDWFGVGPLRLGMRQLTAANTFYTGDAAYVVDPFVGEGIAMALQSAQLIQRAFQQSGAPLTQVYEHLWHQHFDSALRFQRWTRQCMRYPLLHEAAVYGLKMFPATLPWLTRRTRPSIYANSHA